MTGFRKIIMMALQKDMDKYLTIEPLEDNFQIEFNNNCNAVYSLNGGLWAPFENDLSPIMNVGDKLYVKGELEQGNSAGQFYTEQSFDLSGNCNSLIFGDNAHMHDDLTGYDDCYSSLFTYCEGLRNVSKDFLPATTLTSGCYANIFEGCTSLVTTPELPATMLADSCYKRMFSQCSSLVTAPTLPVIALVSECYAYMFQGCTSLETVPGLPATALANGCYNGMFYGCTSLDSTPTLPATTLADSCYNSMFYGTNVLPDCTNIDFESELVVASGGLKGLFAGTGVTDNDLSDILPVNTSTGKYWLPVTTLGNGSYQYMFRDCSLLVTTPVLPAPIMTSYCYDCMFQNCKSLTTPPDLRSLTLANNCYSSMFDGCSNLTRTPALPAENVPYGAYASMFRNCTKLTNVQEIRAKSIGERSCQYMFSGCTSLVTMPELSITTLGLYCCREMFYGCTKLVTPPTLPATTLANYCYHKMFYGCSLMTSSPVLPAKTLVTGCYQYMFQNCSKLNTITALFTTTPTSSYTQSWVSGVASNGIFLKGRDATWNVRGISGVPTNWNFVQEGYENDYVCFESVNGSNIRINWDQTSVTGTIYYSTDALTWQTLSSSNQTPLAKKIYLKGANLIPVSTYPDYGIGKLSVTPINTQYKLSGNCMSLLFGDNGYKNNSLQSYTNAFMLLFEDNTNLVSVSENFLPATVLSESCYDNMFAGCTALKNIPNLPAAVLQPYCYYGMFFNCTSLTDLSGSLLGAKSLALACCKMMFEYCTALTHAPALLAEKLVDQCYDMMFDGCTSLKYIKALFTTTPSGSYTNGWVSGVSSDGMFIKNKNASWSVVDIYGVPPGWETIYGDFDENYLIIEALEDGLKAKMTSTEDSCEYSFDGINWNYLGKNTDSPSINTGQLLYFRSSLTPTSTNGIGTFVITKKCNIKGNCIGMLQYQNASRVYSLTGYNYAFYKLFKDCTNIVNVDPKFLQATTVSQNCYREMFSGCTSLVTAPELPATTISQNCYRSMFQGCTSLATAPELPAKTLQSYCYYYMFYGCSSLTKSPVLYAISLVSYCYGYMFYGCSNLNTITALFTTTPSSSYTGNWVTNVASSGTFYKNPGLTTALPNAHYAVPTGWTQKPHTSSAGGGGDGNVS